MKGVANCFATRVVFGRLVVFITFLYVLQEREQVSEGEELQPHSAIELITPK